MNDNDQYISVDSNQTSTSISGLETGSVYQVKVALCKTLQCPISPADPNAAVMTSVKSIQVVGKLAGFAGIGVIENPGQYSENDMVFLKFDPLVLTNGYATDLNFYCVDPNNYENMVPLPHNTPISGSSIAVCNGLYAEVSGTIDLPTYKQQKIKGIIANGTTEYCFAASPSVSGMGPLLELAPSERIIRCSYPEVKPPSLEQFPGLTNSCNVNGRTSTLTWDLPNGGIYSGFKVFWKEKVSGQFFSFADATAGASGYFNSGATQLAADTVSYEVTNLIPGKTYQFGVLAVTDLPAPTGTLYSEYNLKVLECNLPLPIAGFQGFSRVFAIGPKYDGRIPNDITTKGPSDNARIFEAINSDGIPYEIPMASLGTPDVAPGYYQAPPGRDFANFSSAFDGRKNSSGFSMSRDGIVSLAWEEVDLSHPDVNALFINEQPVTNINREIRRWGYRIYRSHDNKLTWKNITDQSGVIFSMPYSYRKRANLAEIETRMAFFTDYSVNSLKEIHDQTNGRDVDRARIYYYKIVPVFDGKELNYLANTNHHIVRVTLPPPNMALVHRWMANRSHCFEMDKNIDLSDNYSCSYNGIGATGRSFPFRTGNTKYDQKGDLLIDRFELGCRFTRGDKVDDPTVGASHFNSSIPSRPGKSDPLIYPQFRGYKSNGTIVDTSTPFKGCIGANSLASGSTPLGYTADYNQYIHGDCTIASGLSLYHRSCTSDEVGLTPNIYLIPGLGANTVMRDCSENTPDYPSHRAGLIDDKDMLRNHIMHSEFLGVFHNRFAYSTSYPRMQTVYGPKQGDVTAEEVMSISSWGGSNSCAINLASIDSEGYMKPRWIEADHLAGGRINFKGTTDNLLEKTVAEITEVETDPTKPATFFNGLQGDPTAAEFKLPAANLRNSSRYRETTQLGKVMASNASKLPPITSISQNTADALCGTNWVQVGIANDNDQFSATSNVEKKRLIRRTESVTAAAWPESFSDTKIMELESNTPDTPGACLSNNRDYIAEAISKGNFIRNVHTQYAGSNSTLTDMPFLTGSSPYNLFSSVPTQDANTQNCVSKYGIQDMVGNMREMNSERIFCDYSEDGIFLGPVSGWPGSKEARDIELTEPPYDHIPHVSFFNSNAERESWYVLYSATGGLPGSPTTFEFKFPDAVAPQPSSIPANGTPRIGPWVRRSINSGYCSVVDNIAATRQSSNIFADGNGNWHNIFLPGGALNTSMITDPQPDQKAVETLRNGDGHFLDFGPNSLLPALNFTNTLGLKPPTSGTGEEVEAVAQSKYFNPILGLPMKCNGISCKNPLLTSPNDNNLMSTEELFQNLEEVDTEPVIVDFFTGNSVITNPGLSTYSSAHINFF